MNVRALVVSLLAVVFIFVLGVGLYMLWPRTKTVVQPPLQTQAMPDSIKVLSSKVVPSVVARGKVTRVQGNNITLNYQSDIRTIAIRSDAKVYELVNAPQTPLSKSKYTTKAVTFKDIKTGDNLEIDIRVLPTGQIEGLGIMILPS